MEDFQEPFSGGAIDTNIWHPHIYMSDGTFQGAEHDGNYVKVVDSHLEMYTREYIDGLNSVLPELNLWSTVERDIKDSEIIFDREEIIVGEYTIVFGVNNDDGGLDFTIGPDIDEGFGSLYLESYDLVDGFPENTADKIIEYQPGWTRYYKIRESGGQFYFSMSRDGMSWGEEESLPHWFSGSTIDVDIIMRVRPSGSASGFTSETLVKVYNINIIAPSDRDDRDWGIKASVAGESVFSEDQNLAFSSSWKTLQVEHEESFTNVAEGGTILTHNMGFVPLFMPYTNQRFQGSASGIATFNHTFNARVVADDTKIFNANLGLNYSATGRIMVFNFDLTKDYTAPRISNEDREPLGKVNRDWGIKVALPGKNVHSNQTKDFSIHTGTRMPKVHMIKYYKRTQAELDDGASTVYEAQHRLGYRAMCLVYLQNDNLGNYWQVVGNSFDVTIESYFNLVSVYMPYPGQIAIVVLKDAWQI